MPGPPPTPTPILEKRGSHRADYRTNEPQPERGIPETPKQLDKDEIEVWYRVTDQLEKMGVMSKADEWALIRYVKYIVRWFRVEESISVICTAAGNNMITAIGRLEAKDGTVIDGITMKRLMAESRQLDLALKQLENQFGLTPAARARLATGGVANAASGGADAEDW